jgi:hypothetical protein
MSRERKGEEDEINEGRGEMEEKKRNKEIKRELLPYHLPCCNRPGWISGNALSRILFGRRSVRISAPSSKILTDNFLCSSWSPLTNAGIVPQLGHKRFLPNTFSSSFLNVY